MSRKIAIELGKASLPIMAGLVIAALLIWSAEGRESNYEVTEATPQFPDFSVSMNRNIITSTRSAPGTGHPGQAPRQDDLGLSFGRAGPVGAEETSN